MSILDAPNKMDYLEQTACQNESESVWIAALLAPVRAWFWTDNNTESRDRMFFTSWLIFLIIWLLIAFLPFHNFLNTWNGFKNYTMVTVSSLIIFSLLAVLVVLLFRSAACRRVAGGYKESLLYRGNKHSLNALARNMDANTYASLKNMLPLNPA